jgi:hypothetical protein
VPAIVIPVQLAQRCLVELVEDIAQFFFIPVSRGEFGTVEFSQGPHQRVAMLATDFTIFIAMSVIKSRLFHGVLLMDDLACHE